MFKECGKFTYSVDKGAPNLYNNKQMILNSIHEVKFSKSKPFPNNGDDSMALVSTWKPQSGGGNRYGSSLN